MSKALEFNTNLALAWNIPISLQVFNLFITLLSNHIPSGIKNIHINVFGLYAVFER